jgi:hypothetical protein
MSDNPTEEQQYRLDRALLDKHGPSHIDTVYSFAQNMRAKGREANAKDAMKQCDRMRAILMSDRDLLAAYNRTDGEGEEAHALASEVHEAFDGNYAP